VCLLYCAMLSAATLCIIFLELWKHAMR